MLLAVSVPAVLLCGFLSLLIVYFYYLIYVWVALDTYDGKMTNKLFKEITLSPQHQMECSGSVMCSSKF